MAFSWKKLGNALQETAQRAPSDIIGNAKDLGRNINATFNPFESGNNARDEVQKEIDEIEKVHSGLGKATRFLSSETQGDAAINLALAPLAGLGKAGSVGIKGASKIARKTGNPINMSIFSSIARTGFKAARRPARRLADVVAGRNKKFVKAKAPSRPPPRNTAKPPAKPPTKPPASNKAAPKRPRADPTGVGNKTRKITPAKVLGGAALVGLGAAGAQAVNKATTQPSFQVDYTQQPDNPLDFGGDTGLDDILGGDLNDVLFGGDGAFGQGTEIRAGDPFSPTSDGNFLDRIGGGIGEVFAGFGRGAEDVGSGFGSATASAGQGVATSLANPFLIGGIILVIVLATPAGRKALKKITSKGKKAVKGGSK